MAKIREVRFLRKVDRPKATYIYYLQTIGELKRIINENGYVCYDEDEYKLRAKTKHQGRPTKEMIEERKNAATNGNPKNKEI